MPYSFSWKAGPNRRNVEEGRTPAEEEGGAMVRELPRKERIGSDINAKCERDWCYRNGNLEEAKRSPQAKKGYSGAILSQSECVGAVFPALVQKNHHDESS